MAIDPFKARVIELVLEAVAAHGFALAGGNALAAHGLLSRPTQDIDLFTAVAGATGHVLDAVRAALAADGYAVQVVRVADDGDFAELHVNRDGQTTQLDLGRDWRAHDAVRLDVGPVLHLDDAVGSKATALLGRALPRDFIDVGAALDRYTTGAPRAGVHPRPRLAGRRRRARRPAVRPAGERPVHALPAQRRRHHCPSTAVRVVAARPRQRP